MPEKELRREQVLSLTYSVNVRGSLRCVCFVYGFGYSVLGSRRGAFFGFGLKCVWLLTRCFGFNYSMLCSRRGALFAHWRYAYWRSTNWRYMNFHYISNLLKLGGTSAYNFIRMHVCHVASTQWYLPSIGIGTMVFIIN